jgi:Sulfotransferase family
MSRPLHSGRSAQHAPAPAQKIDTPIFLIGSERSGTTLLRLMLDHHPELAFNLESEFLVADISAAGVFPDVAGYRRSLAADRVFRHSRFTVRDDLDFPALLNDFLRQKLERDGKRVVGATVHYGFRKLQYVWPNAKYIYLLRDGRDVAASVVEMGWAGNVFVGANWWLEAERDWAELRPALPPDRWIEVRYEELTAQAATQLQRVCEFIGVPYSERMFDYAASSTYSLPNPAQNFKWGRKLTAPELSLLEARIGAQLAARGYEVRNGRLPRIGRMRTRWLEWQSRLGVVRRKAELFGWPLLAKESISRRLRWTRLHGDARRAMDAIVDRNLK